MSVPSSKRSQEGLKRGADAARAIRPLVGVQAITWGSNGDWRSKQAVPDHTAEPIQLLCFELLPYAMVRAGLITKSTFLEGAKTRTGTSTEDGSIGWAQFLGEQIGDKVAVTDLGKTTLFPGDIVIIYGAWSGGLHTVIVSDTATTEKGPMVFSLTTPPPSEYVVEEPLAQVLVEFAKFDPSYVRLFSLK